MGQSEVRLRMVLGSRTRLGALLGFVAAGFETKNVPASVGPPFRPSKGAISILA